MRYYVFCTTPSSLSLYCTSTGPSNYTNSYYGTFGNGYGIDSTHVMRKKKSKILITKMKLYANGLLMMK